MTPVRRETFWRVLTQNRTPPSGYRHFQFDLWFMQRPNVRVRATRNRKKITLKSGFPWLTFAKVKGCAKEVGASLDSALRNSDVIVPSMLGLDMREDQDGALTFLPKCAELASEEFHQVFERGQIPRIPARPQRRGPKEDFACCEEAMVGS